MIQYKVKKINRGNGSDPNCSCQALVGEYFIIDCNKEHSSDINIAYRYASQYNLLRGKCGCKVEVEEVVV